MDTDELIFKKFLIQDNGSLPLVAKGAAREHLAGFLGEIGFNRGAEIGVRKGDYSERLCRNNPNLKLKSIDPWGPFRYNSDRRQESYYKYACDLLKPYGVEIIRKTSVDAAKDVPNGSLDFVYIDAMHEFDDVMMDILTWVPKVRVGGIISGHDYTPHAWWNGVTSAVNAYTNEHEMEKWYITDPLRDRQIPSFFWVKK
jgi:hypothetical protein